MLKKVLNHHLTSSIGVLKRSTTVSSDVDLFDQMKQLNEKKQFKQALELFDQYKKNKAAISSKFIITQVLKACAQTGDLKRGSSVHHLLSPELRNDRYILASLIHLYMQCGDVTQAQQLFNTSSKKTLGMYGAMMKGYIKNHQATKAIDLFNEIDKPDEVIIIIMFNACAQLGTNQALNLIKNVYEQIPKSFFSNDRLSTSLFDALIKCGDCSSAEIVFSKIKRSITSYGNLMNGFNKANNPEKTLNLFNQMKIDRINPNFIIYLCVIKALSQIGDFVTSESIVEKIPNSILVSNEIKTALIGMWGKTGYVDRAKQIFKKIDHPDEIGYIAMINSYGLNGIGTEAIELYRRMPPELINEVAHVCVLNACSHSGLVDEARSIFNTIQIKTDKIYTTMIDCLSRASIFEEAQKLIDEFERDNSPVLPMYMALLSGARNEKNSSLAQLIFHRMKKLFPELRDSLTSASVLLANVYAASGELDKASDIRNELNKSGAKKHISVTLTRLNGQFYQFRPHDRSHPRSSEIYAEVEKISKELIEHGHQYDASWITRRLDQNETVESVLCGHSERLAIGFHFVENPNTKRIQLTKNLRVCGDCHRATKLIASIRQCEIIVRDANRIHHFYPNGQCSCNDYF